MQEYFIQIISTLIVIVLVPISKVISAKIIKKYSQFSRKFLESRVRHVTKVVSILINLTGILMIIVIWGVDPRNIILAASSVFAIIGVAFFAQWSLLSNITAGILIFFTTPIRIGDMIIIHDKEAPIEAEVINILTFHVHFKAKNGEVTIYPNSLLFQKGFSIIDNRDLTQEEN